jgi:hypothetical protein
MKKTAILAGLISFFSITAMAQQPDTTQPAQSSNATVASIQSKYKLLPMPEALTLEKTFPVIGSYQFTGAADAPAVNATISIDEQNKGIVWIDGLPEGRIKAYLRKSPSTYKIPAQKLEDGKSIAEGTLIYDKDNNQIQVCIGCKYNEEDPATAFATATVTEEAPVADKKSKAKAKTPKVKVISYTGQKTDVAVTSSTSMQ